MKFAVSMQRSIVQTAVVEVDAPDWRAARSMADDMREEADWSATDSDYAPIGVEDVEEVA
ncbi:MAG: hypothetical protein WC455_12885 [Dehalococcoidia bacterium]